MCSAESEQTLGQNVSPSITFGPAQTSPTSSESPPKKRKTERKCSQCGNPGHTRSSCPATAPVAGPSWQQYCAILEENRDLRISIAELEAVKTPTKLSYASVAESNIHKSKSQVVSPPPSKVPPPKNGRTPEKSFELRVKTREGQSREDLERECAEILKKHGLFNLKIMSCRLTGGSITYRLAHESDHKRMRETLQCEGLQPEVPGILPEIAVVIPSTIPEDWSPSDIVEDLNRRNAVNFELIKRNDRHVFCKVPSPDFARIEDQGLYLANSRTKFFLSLRVNKCFKCHQLGHFAKDCPSTTEVCPKCSGPHLSHQCTSMTMLCPLCKSTEHSAMDYRRCPVLQKAMNYRRNLMGLNE